MIVLPTEQASQKTIEILNNEGPFEWSDVANGLIEFVSIRSILRPNNNYLIPVEEIKIYEF